MASAEHDARHPVETMAFRFKPDRSLHRGVVRLIKEQIARAAAAAADRSRPVPDRVHEARTGCKKIRALLLLVRQAGPGKWKRENARFRAAARALAPLRDAAVLPAALSALAKDSKAISDRRALQRVRPVILQACRDRLADRPAVERALAGFVAEMRAAERRLSSWKVTVGDSGLIEEGFGETYRRARRAWRRAQKKPSTSSLHDLRKRTKAHGFQVRLFRRAEPAAMRAWNADVSRLGDLLGDANDLAMLDARVRDLDSPTVPGPAISAVRSAIAARQERLRVAAAKVGARCFGEKKSVVVRRLASGWKAAAKAR